MFVCVVCVVCCVLCVCVCCVVYVIVVVFGGSVFSLPVVSIRGFI